ncbi:MAG: tetratricopeptide repeat protein [Bradyrhizobium sp.]|nr:tetratricopeptide repeat protein [Bradyrhizobium sp.]
MLKMIGGRPLLFVSLLLAAPASAQAQAQAAKTDGMLKNIELCNRIDRAALDTRISGCTVLIDANYGTTAAQAIAYNNRGNAYIAKGDFDRAIQDFDQSIKLNANYAKPLSNRGVALMRKGEYDGAIEAFDEAIRLKPSYANAYLNRAEAYLKKGDHARAIEDYDEAIRLNPGLDIVWHGRCWAQAVLGDLQPALEACNKALQSGINNAATYDSLGLIHLKMEQPGKAIDDYDAAVRLNPKLASALYGRGLARLKTGDKAGSDADIAAAKAIAAGVDDEFARYGVK